MSGRRLVKCLTQQVKSGLASSYANSLKECQIAPVAKTKIVAPGWLSGKNKASTGNDGQVRDFSNIANSGTRRGGGT